VDQTKTAPHFKLIFATGNLHKLHEVQFTLKEYPLIIEQRPLKGIEIQSDDLGEVAITSVLGAVQRSGAPTFVEDTGLFVEALKGFPGVFTSYTYQTLGASGLLKLLDGETNRRAVFKSAVAYCAPHNRPVCFRGEVSGRISRQARGVHGFGFDAVFEPDPGGGQTFGEMGIDEKNRWSHRARAVRRFAAWLLTDGIA
jgi:XTP/dITP diphosphohydrolase